MKSSLAFSAVLAAVISASAFAADGSKMPANDSTATAKPHSHVMEKTGMPASKGISTTADGKTTAGKDKSRHFHPRDGK